MTHIRRFLAGAVLVLCTLGTSTAFSSPAQALGGFHVSSGSWNVRSSIGGAVVGSVRGGQGLDIACQSVGPAASVSGFGTSTVYDYLNGPVRGWVSDLAIAETPYARRDPRLPDCGGQPAPVSGAEQAARWAEAHVGQVYTSENRNAGYWSGWCETFVEKAWGDRFRFASADAQYRVRASNGQIRGGVPPRGAIVFYAPNHVGISVGNGQVVATQGYTNQRLPVIRVSYSWFSGYRGWAMP